MQLNIWYLHNITHVVFHFHLVFYSLYLVRVLHTHAHGKLLLLLRPLIDLTLRHSHKLCKIKFTQQPLPCKLSNPWKKTFANRTHTWIYDIAMLVLILANIQVNIIGIRSERVYTHRTHYAKLKHIIYDVVTHAISVILSADSEFHKPN